MLDLFKLYNISFYKDMKDIILAYGLLYGLNIMGAVLLYLDLQQVSAISELWFKTFFTFLTLHLFCMTLAPSNILDFDITKSKTNKAASGVLENILPVGRKNFLINRILATFCSAIVMGVLLVLPFIFVSALLKVNGMGVSVEFLKGLFSMLMLIIFGALIFCMLTVLYHKKRGMMGLGYSIYSISTFLLIREELLLSHGMWLLGPLFMLLITLVLYKYAAKKVYQIDICQ
ncbi:hypothetical protein PRVXT_000668 [Proteinivorax tanatarense]|uniref:ABC-2 family transporter protein n=1 Tax=Proteinivorax tanatarense TaxID=1260629 RepID=A0AAU7VN97_9FIRM